MARCAHSHPLAGQSSDALDGWRNPAAPSPFGTPALRGSCRSTHGRHPVGGMNGWPRRDVRETRRAQVDIFDAPGP